MRHLKETEAQKLHYIKTVEMFINKMYVFKEWDSRTTRDLMNGNATVHNVKKHSLQGYFYSGTRTMDIGQSEWMVGEQDRYTSATGA